MSAYQWNEKDFIFCCIIKSQQPQLTLPIIRTDMIMLYNKMFLH